MRRCYAFPMSRQSPALLEAIGPLLDQEVAALVPAQYAAWRPLVAGGLRFFLENLPARRLSAIVAEQLTLPAAGVAERVTALLRHCPTLHKLGQVVARDHRLAPELRRQLQALESLPATTPMAGIRRVIRRELGTSAELRIAPEALAEGSVAVAVPFAWERGTERGEGVFKVLKPGVAQRLAEDLEIWGRLAGFLEECSVELGLPELGYGEVLASVGRLLENEIRLEGEQAHMAAARRSASPGVLVPALLPWCTPRLTAMERVHGVPVTEAAGLDATARRRLATTLLEALLARPFLAPAERVPFHADAHAGNLFLADDGRRAVEEALAQVRRGRFPGLAWSLDLLDRVATRGALRFPEELLLLRKALLTLQGVVADVDGACPADAVLIRAGLARFVGELPQRLTRPLDSRAFGCPLATADLLALALDTPAAALRYWSGQWQDWAALWRLDRRVVA